MPLSDRDNLAQTLTSSMRWPGDDPSDKAYSQKRAPADGERFIRTTQRLHASFDPNFDGKYEGINNLVMRLATKVLSVARDDNKASKPTT